jgi:phage-related protein
MRGPLLDEPYTRRLGGKLRELRFYLGRDQRRIAYYLAHGQRAILLTVFRKQRSHERAEIDRAMRAMERCIREGHTAEA